MGVGQNITNLFFWIMKGNFLYNALSEILMGILMGGGSEAIQKFWGIIFFGPNSKRCGALLDQMWYDSGNFR